MSITYVRDPEIEQLVHDRIKKVDQDMHAAGVRFGVLVAENDDGKSSVKHGGYAANATVRIVSLKDRVTKGYDAEMLVARESWDSFTPRQRDALIAHEVEHARLKLNKKGDPVFDDLGRPKLKLVRADGSAGDFFASVVQEFGDDAIEYTNIRTAKAFLDKAKTRSDTDATGNDNIDV